jgi:hypothetical protein
VVALFLTVVLGGGTFWHLQKFLQCIRNIELEFTPFTAFHYAPQPIPGIVSTAIIFAFTYMFAQ